MCTKCRPICTCSSKISLCPACKAWQDEHAAEVPYVIPESTTLLHLHDGRYVWSRYQPDVIVEVHRLRDRGISIDESSVQLGIPYTTVRYLRHAEVVK